MSRLELLWNAPGLLMKYTKLPVLSHNNPFKIIRVMWMMILINFKSFCCQNSLYFDVFMYFIFFFKRKKHSVHFPLLFEPASSDLWLTSPWRQRTACFLPTDTSPIVMVVDSCLRELPWDWLRPIVRGIKTLSNAHGKSKIELWTK